MKRVSLASLSVLAIVAAACTSGGGGPTPSSPTVTPSGTIQPSPVSVVLPASAVDFGEYDLVPLLGDDAPDYSGPPTPDSLDDVLIAREIRAQVTDPAVAKALTSKGFAIVPADFRLFHTAYEENVYSGWPIFVTTDAALNTWHLVFDKVLRSLEQGVLLPKLETLVAGMLDAAERQASQAEGGAVSDAADRVVQLLQVAGAELGIPVGTLGPAARAEKALIDAHSKAATSPILGTKIDYTLYTPRGHYTRNEDLTRFFVAMSVLGQSAFCLPGARECSDGIAAVRAAILASRALVSSQELVGLWRDLYEPTAFLVGAADDYTPLEVRDAAQAAAGGLADIEAFESDATVQRVADELVSRRPVRIDPERPSIRLMGTRFVIDSFVLDQLIFPNVGTESEPRNVPSALDLASAFGSPLAAEIQRASGQEDFANYSSRMRRMRRAIATRPDDEWGGTVYDAWLAALEPLWVEHGAAFPDFMRTDAWAAKDLQTGAGSYTELKHDTILFTKQAAAEGGDGQSIPGRRNWVEPDPVVFGRLRAMTELMRGGLASRELLPREYENLLTDTADLFAFFERIATDELAGEPISNRDNERLTFIGGVLEAFWWRTSDEDDADEDAAVIADIASSPDGFLEVGTGRIDRIFVLVPDDRGRFQVALGGVYSFYEFVSPSERLTDEQWRERLSDGAVPPRPDWEPVIGG
jgi:hypothetical protein